LLQDRNEDYYRGGKMKRIFILFLLLTQISYGRVFIKITKNFTEKAEIVILLKKKPDIYWRKFIKTLAQDLEYSGFFTVNEARFIKNLEGEKKKYSTELLLYNLSENGRIKFVIEDILDNKRIFEDIFTPLSNPREFAHLLNDKIVFALTGKPGIASTKILFVSDKDGSHQIYSIDYDGENIRKITNEKYHLAFPRWFSKNSFLFISYKGGWPKIVKYSISTGKKEILLAHPGLNACPSISISTKEIAAVLSKSGNPEIYITDFYGNIKKRLTYYRGIDSSPSFSPDGKNICFVSDRQGSAQIFIMDKDGYRVKRISYISSYSTCPRWSPDGNFIAYIILKRKKFGIAIYEVPTGKTKIVGENLGCEEISWAPDSRHIVYTKSDKFPSTLWIFDIYTKEKRRLTESKYNAFSPSWSYN